MALITNVEINISINDEGIGFVEKEPGMTEVGNYSEVRLPKGVVKNGYIKEPEILLNKLKFNYYNCLRNIYKVNICKYNKVKRSYYL